MVNLTFSKKKIVNHRNPIFIASICRMSNVKVLLPFSIKLTKKEKHRENFNFPNFKNTSFVGTIEMKMPEKYETFGCHVQKKN